MGSVGKVCVIGGGTMGRGIVAAFLNADIPVTLVERNSEALQLAASMVKKLRKRGQPDLLTLSVDLPGPESGPQFDLFIEAVYENLALKEEIFAHLDRVAKPTAVLATNTSTLNINQIAAATERACCVVGMHFFNPPHKNRLLEVVLGSQTGPDVVQRACAVARRLDKVPVVVRNCPGFVANRMCNPYFQGVQRLISLGVSPYRVDGVLESCGLVLGPCKTQDLIGFDLLLHIGRANGWDFLRQGLIPSLARKGRLGRKTGKGWYSFDRSSKRQSEDREVLELVRSHAKPSPSPISEAEIIEYTLFPLVNEGFKVVDESVVNSVQDIDTIWLHGYGWPPASGGPMRWAFEAGLADLVRCMDRHHAETKLSLFAVSPLLRRVSGCGAAEAEVDSWMRQNLWNLHGAPVPLPGQRSRL